MKRLAMFTLACVVASAPAVAGARGLVPDDEFRLTSFSNPAFSPDGTELVAVESHADRRTDAFVSKLVLVDVASGAQRSLTTIRKGLGQPLFSPDGREITFIADDAHGHGQIQALPLDGGDATVLTATKNGVQQYAWRPDGRALAFVTQDDDPREAAIKAHHDFFDLGNDDVDTRAATPPSHVWIVGADGHGAHRLTGGRWSTATSYPPAPPASPLSWSADGRSLLLTRVPTTSDGDAYRSEIVRLDVASGKLTPLTGHGKFEGFATYSPNGTNVAYLYSRDGDPNNEQDILVTSAAGGAGRDVSRTLDRAFFRAQWMPDGTSLLVGGHDGTQTDLWRLKLDGSSEKLHLGPVAPEWFFWMDTAVDAHGAIAFAGSEPGHPDELYYRPAAGGALRRLTDANAAIAALDLGRVETIRWRNDGMDEDGVLTYPPGYTRGRRYPLVLLVHGGPQYATVENFDAMRQVIAARGNLVFEPNYRGSDNHGNAYERAIYMDAGAGPGRDVMAGVAAVQARGIVDPARIAVSGWSYGGYMTSWLMSHYHMMSHYHIWKTAISGAAVNNWVDMYDLGDGNVQIGFSFHGSPYVGRNRADMLAQSPITYAAQTRCPVLIISDMGDVRVPVAQSFEMYHALHDNGIPVRFVGIPVAGHFPSDPVRQVDVDKLWLSWLGEHLR